MSRTRSCIAMLACLAGCTAAAAPPVPAHWTVTPLSTKAIAPGATFELALTARIDPGWHLYALQEPDGGPMPTEIGLAEGDPLTLLDVKEPEPHKVPDPLTHSVAGVFQELVRFILRVRAPRTPLPPGAASRVLVRYQTCNDQVCLPPHTETVTLPLRGVVR